MRGLRLLLPLVGLLMLLAVLTARATCVGGDIGTAGNDTIDCTTTNPPTVNVQAGAGDDVIIVEAGVVSGVDVSGGSTGAVAEAGNDTIIIDGTVDEVIGDSRNGNGSGDDVIIINNTTNNAVYGDSNTGTGSGNDTIINNNSVGADIVGDSVVTDGSGSDTIINNGTSASIWVDSRDGVGTGNDTVVNNGLVAGSIYGDSVFNDGHGDDTITNNGNVANIWGDTNLGTGATGDDTITNNGIINRIFGDNGAGTGSGNDTITNNGTVNFFISAGGGNDTVIIGANTATVAGNIDGGAGYDVLTFNLTSTDPAVLLDAAAQIAAANPNGGTITLGGHTYTWLNFEELTQLIFSLARINGVMDPLAVFCSLTGGVDIYAISGSQGILAVAIGAQQISNGITAAVASGNSVQIGGSADATINATATGEVQVSGTGGFSFSFVYQNYCGTLPVATGEPLIVQEEEELPAFSIINQPYGG